ncbi:putative reverse transcriptase domain-containing protein [Tanacetum coccineum]
MDSVNKQAMGNSRLEDLPQEVLVKVLCGVEHRDCKSLFYVSHKIREVAILAKEYHFDYTTPRSFHSSFEFQAPKKSIGACSRLNRKELAKALSSASSVVTYTSVYNNSEPGRVFWGADEEKSDGGISRVILYGYDGFPMQPVAPPSPDYIPGPEELQTPPVPQDEDEREPMFIQPHDPNYGITESDPEEDPEEYEDDETEDGPVDYPMDGGDDGDDDDGDSSRDDIDDEDEDEEEEEHLAPADSAVVVPTVELVSPPKGT